MRKSRQQLLNKFTKHLFLRDPMGICYPDNPDKETEYEVEALSILSRFVEGHLVGMSTDEAQEVAFCIVQRSFNFWFGCPLVDETKVRELANELLGLLLAARPEQVTEPEVESET